MAIRCMPLLVFGLNLVFNLDTVHAYVGSGPDQKPLTPISSALGPPYQGIVDHPLHPPRIVYAQLDSDRDDMNTNTTELLKGMVPTAIHISGNNKERFDLMFFSDGYTIDEYYKFEEDVRILRDDIVSNNGSMGHVADLLNIWATFIPSKYSGIGTHDKLLPGSVLGLYRPGSELRAVYVKHPKIARSACKWFKDGKAGEGGCDQAILLGNDPLYGGLGGEFTIITASKLNGPQILRHELGHSLIPVGEEYDGGFVYEGVNSDKVESLENLSWKDYLSDPDHIRIEDAKMAVQAYPWHDLDKEPYNIPFSSFNLQNDTNRPYPTALLRTSLSSIPYSSHIDFILNGISIDLSAHFPQELEGSHDRRWLDLPLLDGLKKGENVIKVKLTEKGQNAEAGQGGKMITSLEVVEYGGGGRFNDTKGNIGAYPTFDLTGRMTLRPTNEECLMRNVTHPNFCPVCADQLRQSLLRKIAGK